MKPRRIGRAVFALCGSLNSGRVIEMFSTLMMSSHIGSFALTILCVTCVSNAPDILLCFVVVPTLEVARPTNGTALGSGGAGMCKGGPLRTVQV